MSSPIPEPTPAMMPTNRGLRNALIANIIAKPGAGRNIVALEMSAIMKTPGYPSCTKSAEFLENSEESTNAPTEIAIAKRRVRRLFAFSSVRMPFFFIRGEFARQGFKELQTNRV